MAKKSSEPPDSRTCTLSTKVLSKGQIVQRSKIIYQSTNKIKKLTIYQ